MTRTLLLASIGALAFAASPALAQSVHVGGGAGAHVRVGATSHANGGVGLGGMTGNTGVMNDLQAKTHANVDAGANARVNSQGPAHANINGLTHANEHSVLAGAANASLTGLANGTTVLNTSATSIGTVTGTVTNRSGGVVGVKVQLTDGTMVTIPASSFTLSGSTLTTTWVRM